MLLSRCGVHSKYVNAPIAGRVLHLVLHYELYTEYFVGAILLCIMHSELCGMDHDAQRFLSCTFSKCVGKYDLQSVPMVLC